MTFWEYLDKRGDRIEKRSSTLDVMIARTQRGNTYFYGALFILTMLPLFFIPDPSDVVKTILIASSSTIGTIMVMQNQFWYGRPRGAGIPDPAGTTTVVTPPSDPNSPAPTVTTTVTPNPPNPEP